MLGIHCGRPLVYQQPCFVLAPDARSSRIRIPGSGKDYPIPSCRTPSLRRWLGEVLVERCVYLAEGVVLDNWKL